MRALPFFLKKSAAYADINEIPWKDLIEGTLPCGIEVHIRAAFRKGFQPPFILKPFAPGVKKTPLLISSLNGRADPPVSSGKNPFQHRDIRFMPVVFDAFLILLLFDLMIDHISAMKKFFLCTHLRPLKRRKGLGHEEGSADHDLALFIPLFLRYIIIPFGDLFRQPCNPFHIFFIFGGKSQHKIQFYPVPSSLKRLPGAFQDHFLRKPLIDHIPKPLRARLRRKSQAAFFHILHFPHDIQRKSIDAKRRQ